MPHVMQRKETDIYNYYFSASFLDDAGCRTFGITDAAKAGILAMGILSFCNHSDLPNAKVSKTVKGNIIIFSLEALQDIPANNEITISYGKLWFEAV